VEKRIADEKVKISRLLDLYVEGRYARQATLTRQRQIENALEALEEERERFMRRLDAVATQQAEDASYQRFATTIAAGLDAAEESFQRRRSVVEVLDITIRLEKENDKAKRAHIEFEGRPVGSVIVPKLKRDRRSSAKKKGS
jgi:hypothetical protein